MMRPAPAIGFVAASVMLGCGPASEPRPSPVDVSQALVPVELPDLGGMHELVQVQFREAHASLMSVESGRGTSPLARSEAYGQLGKLLMAAEYLDVAERCFRNAQLLAAGDFRWPYYLGHLFEKQGDLTKTAEYFEQALRIRPTDFAALTWLVSTYIDLGQPEKAEPLLVKARALYPDTPVVLFQQGRAAVATQDYASAVEHLEAALRLNPAATIIHYPLGMAYRGLGDLEKAEYHLDRSGRRAGAGFVAGVTMDLPDPLMADVSMALRSPQRYRDLALQADANGEWEEAARQFRNAVEMEPDNPVMRLSLGMALNRAGNARAALTELDEAVRLDPQLAQAHFTLGTLLERSGRDQEAIDRYTAAVSHDANSREVHLRLADALRRTGRFDASLAHYQRVLELDPDGQEARFGEAMALVRLGRHREARERLSVALDLHPEHTGFANALARLLAASPHDQIRDGRRAFELVQAVVEGEKTTAVAETMAMALAELGEFTGAAEWQRMAMEVAQDAGRPDIAQQMSANLALYDRREPCRTPWRDDEPEHRPGPNVEPGLLDPAPSF